MACTGQWLGDYIIQQKNVDLKKKKYNDFLILH